MQVRTLRIQHNWSQEQLAHMSGLSVRTIQRIEKGDNIGLETLKSLAAVFEVNVSDLKEDRSMTPEVTISEVKSNSDESIQQQKDVLEKAKSIKNLYLIIFCLSVIFILFIVPNYNDGENLGPIVVVGISFIAMVGYYAYSIFEPFGEEWEQNKAKEILKKQKNNNEDSK
jgi:transcriptional regulator with XRE-family HTH domain